MRLFNRQAMLGTVVALALTGALGDCAPAQQHLGDQLSPSLGGLPQNAPQRPATNTYQYPAVHDMPPQRPMSLMSEEERRRLEAELGRVRDQQMRRSGQKPSKTN
jgi:hypothetical protein